MSQPSAKILSKLMELDRELQRLKIAIYSALPRSGGRRSRSLGETSASEQAWANVRGMWKDKDHIDPVAYQRKLRDEADHVEV